MQPNKCTNVSMWKQTQHPESTLRVKYSEFRGELVTAALKSVADRV